MEDGDTEPAEIKLEGHGKGKEIHYEDLSKYQLKAHFPSASKGQPIGKQKLTQNEENAPSVELKAISENEAPTKVKFAEVADETEAPITIKGVSQMEEAKKMEQEKEFKTISVTETPTEAKFASQMEEAKKVEQERELPKSCIPILSSMPPSINLNEEKAP
ncbi:hypothetical protein ACLOJK_034358 [Asimina triloba]